LINQYDKILEARPIELACSAAETIIIKTNTAIEGHTERVLERLLRDLRERYGIEKKNVQKQNFYKNGIITEYPNGLITWSIGKNYEVIYIVKNVVELTNGEKEYELEKSEIGDSIIDIYLNNPSFGTDKDCCVASLKRFEQGFYNNRKEKLSQYLLKTNFWDGIDDKKRFNVIWHTIFNSFERYKVPLDIAGKGGSGVVELANLGKCLTTEDILNGMLKPGAIVQYWQNPNFYEKLSIGTWDIANSEISPGHSFIFLGYKFDENGKISEYRQWDYNSFSYTSFKIKNIYNFGNNYEI
jgi:hypothetical protein